MKMTDAILPGHTSPDNIKAALTMLTLSFLFLLARARSDHRHGREYSLSPSQDDSNSRQRDFSSQESTFQHLFLCFF